MSGRELIYRQVQAYLQDLIDRGDLKPGDRLPSERTLAKQFNTSNMPVRQAIQHFIDKGLCQRFHGRGTFLREEENQSRTMRTAVLHVYDSRSFWNSSFYTGIMSGIQEVLEDYNQRLIVQSIHERELYSNLCSVEDDVDGIIILDLFPSYVPDVERYARQQRKPLVVSNYPHEWNKVSAVGTHNKLNMKIAVQHLLEQGHQRIAYLYNYTTLGNLRELHPHAWEKRDGYRAALTEADVPLDESLEIVTNDFATDQEMLQEIIDKGCTAIAFSGSHMYSPKFIHAYNELHLSFNNMALIGYDRVNELEDLSCIDIEIADIGRQSAEELMRLVLSSPAERRFQSTQLTGSVIERGSTPAYIPALNK